MRPRRADPHARVTVKVTVTGGSRPGGPDNARVWRRLPGPPPAPCAESPCGPTDSDPVSESAPLYTRIMTTGADAFDSDLVARVAGGPDESLSRPACTA